METPGCSCEEWVDHGDAWSWRRMVIDGKDSNSYILIKGFFLPLTTLELQSNIYIDLKTFLSPRTKALQGKPAEQKPVSVDSMQQMERAYQTGNEIE